MRKILHIVWSPTTGPIVAYSDSSVAFAHARTITGAEVGSCELRAQLPEVVRDDIQSEWEDDEQTPRVVDVELEAIPDVIQDGGQDG